MLLGLLLIIVILIGLIFFILNIKLSVSKLVISNINSLRKIKTDFSINIGLYIGKKIKLFSFDFDKSILKNNKFIKKIKNNKDINKIERKKFLKKIVKVNYCCESLELNINLGTDNCILTSYIVPIMATIIETGFMKINSYDYNPSTNYRIRPIYNKGNIIDIRLDGSVYIRVKNLLKVMFT